MPSRSRFLRVTTLAFGAALTLQACSSPAPAVTEPAKPSSHSLSTLAIPGLQQRGAAIAATGEHVVVTWTAGNDKETNVFAATSRDGGETFGAPVRVNNVAGDARFSGEQAPRVAIGKDIVVAWQSRPNGKSAIRISRSRDGGATFSPAMSVHKDGLEGSRGWASLSLDASGFAHVAWLDTRPAAAAKRPAAPAPAAGHVHGGGMATPQNIYHAMMGVTGAPVESRIAPDVCFCCKTSIATAPDGTLYAAWRHIYAPNFRDMAVARSSTNGETFEPPVRLSEDGWAIDGCPEDGPSLAVDASGVLHVAWPTIAPGRTDRKAIFYTYSTDGGRTFAPRVRMDEFADARKPAHPQLTISESRVLVTWDEDDGDKRHIRVRSIEPEAGAQRWTPRLGPTIAVDIAATASYPAIATTPKGAVIAWTATGDNSTVQIARVEFP